MYSRRTAKEQVVVVVVVVMEHDGWVQWSRVQELRENERKRECLEGKKYMQWHAGDNETIKN